MFWTIKFKFNAIKIFLISWSITPYSCTKKYSSFFKETLICFIDLIRGATLMESDRLRKDYSHGILDVLWWVKIKFSFNNFSKIFHQSINQSRQQLRNEPHESHHHHRSQQLQNHSNNARDPARRQTNDIKSSIHQNSDGNLLISIPKTKASIGIAIEGGANTKHPLPRIINIHVSSFLTH